MPESSCIRLEEALGLQGRVGDVCAQDSDAGSAVWLVCCRQGDSDAYGRGMCLGMPERPLAPHTSALTVETEDVPHP